MVSAKQNCRPRDLATAGHRKRKANLRKTAWISQKPEGYRELLRTGDAKTVKGESEGYLTAVLYLAPARSSGVINVCLFAGKCEGPCLNTAGRGIQRNVQEARIRKTRFYAENSALFLECLAYDIERLERRAQKLGLKLAVRINGTSDIPKLGMALSAKYPQIQFYDYTKCPKAWLRARANYHITFSLDTIEGNGKDALDALAHGINAAVVFSTRKGEPLPAMWQGYAVLDGDKNDLRFLDPKGYVVGLRAKGKAKTDTSGFVQIAGAL
jgi:hypothetical protein